MQLTLSSPEITCDHCIATIERTVGAVDGARFVRGDADARQFAIEVEHGAVLDAVAAALLEEGYPLGDASASGDGAPATAAPSDWRPDYRVTRTGAGADVNYDCPCSCDAGFAFDRAQTEQAPESCCCGRRLLVGADAAGRLRAALDDPGAFEIDEQELTMPWGQPMQAALAIPRDGGKHGDG